MAYPKIQCTYNTTLHIKPVPFLFRNIVLAELSSFITPVFFPVTNGPLLSRQVANTTVMYPLQLKLGCLRHTRTPCTPAWSAASQTGRQCVCVCINCNNRDPFSSIQGSGENIVPSLWPIMAIRRSNIRTVFDKAWPLLQDTINGHLSCLGKIDPFPLDCCLCVHEQRQTQSASISRAICLWRALQLDNTEFLDDGNYSLQFKNFKLNVPQRHDFGFSVTVTAPVLTPMDCHHWPKETHPALPDCKPTASKFRLRCSNPPDPPSCSKRRQATFTACCQSCKALNATSK